MKLRRKGKKDKPLKHRKVSRFRRWFAAGSVLLATAFGGGIYNSPLSIAFTSG